MVPTAPRPGPTLTEVMPSCLAALQGERNPFGLRSADRVLLVLVDGLGASNLAVRSGHARYLTRSWDDTAVISSGWPSTTAAAIASVMTGELPGQHGLVGYNVLDPATDRLVNQLSGWGGTVNPASWQRASTVFEQAAAGGLPSFSIGPAKYASSGFTAAVLRGSQYVAAGSLADRFAAVRGVFDSHRRALAYLYVPELDMAAHARGWQSDRWTAELEILDAAVSGFAATLSNSEGMLLTADHGVLDVPRSGQVLVDQRPHPIRLVRQIGGEPRCLHLYLAAEAGDAGPDSVAAAWRDAEGDRAWVRTRAEAVQEGWFGPVHPDVLPRIGDVLVAARADVAYYDSRTATAGSQAMIGQHGSWTQTEVEVPLLRFGAFR